MTSPLFSINGAIIGLGNHGVDLSIQYITQFNQVRREGRILSRPRPDVARVVAQYFNQFFVHDRSMANCHRDVIGRNGEKVR